MYVYIYIIYVCVCVRAYVSVCVSGVEIRKIFVAGCFKDNVKRKVVEKWRPRNFREIKLLKQLKHNSQSFKSSF